MGRRHRLLADLPRVRAADGAFGEFAGILIAIAVVGILGIAAAIFLGSILLPIAAVLVVPAVGTWLAYKIICGAFTRAGRGTGSGGREHLVTIRPEPVSTLRTSP